MVGRIYGMKHSGKGHEDRNRHKNRIKRSGQARLAYVYEVSPGGTKKQWPYSPVTHIKIHDAMCTLWCLLRPLAVVKALLHTLQMKGLWPVWIRLCLLRPPLVVKALSHTSQAKGF